ncbi:MAG: putative toxin-antitoxin system toxin component, PIN family [Candidatus Competibacteraceae bacterium]
MRAVIDTNVLLSGLFWHGAPHVLLTHVRAATLGLVSSPALLAELQAVIGRAKFAAILTRSNTSRERVLAEVRQLAEVIEPPPLAAPVCRDPDDDMVLALALAAQVDLLVSGDEDLLALTHYQGIPIVTAVQAVEQFT